MLARWSLRAKLIAAVFVVLLPLLGALAWQGFDRQGRAEADASRGRAAEAALAAARFEALVDGARRVLVAACNDDAVRGALVDAASVPRCDSYWARLLAAFPDQYATGAVLDTQGTARCSSNQAAVGVTFRDREVFGLARASGRFTLGAPIASRTSGSPVLPAALPILRDGTFQGLCVLTLTLKSVGEQLAARPGRTADEGPVVVDRSGASLAGDPLATRALPVPSRVAAAIVGDQRSFSDYGQDGVLRAFTLAPLAGTGLHLIVSGAAGGGSGAALDAWSGFAGLLLALLLVVAVLWFGAERWCVGPLRYIQEFAGRVARGEDIELAPRHPWGPELSSVAEGVKAMAQAIATREAELRAGLEQRDHMLREIHHRVKNNLQMISSLLNLQAGEIRSPRIRRFFGDAQNRVLTLSILHRHLYERSSWALVDFQQFLSDLVRQISAGRRRGEVAPPRYHIRAPIMAVGPDIAIPIGLIVTEAVSSALNRTYEASQAPEIRIEAGDKDGLIELVIEDNGTGASGALGAQVRSGFGLTLIRGLAMQLGGEAHVAVRDGGGTRVSVTFPMPETGDADG